MKTLTNFLLLGAFLLPVSLLSQNVSVTDTFTVNELLEELFGAGVTISNVVVQGDTTNAMGYFSGGAPTIGLPEGIVLSTGNATNLDLSSPTAGQSGNLSFPGDADLTAVANATTYDAMILEFDLVSDCDTILIEYVFGSNEYPTFVGLFNDVFAFWIDGPGYTTSTNIALVPGTTQPVSINNVNNSSGCTNCQYFVGNGSPQVGVALNGHTTPLQAIASVTPDSSYHIKIAIADAMDGAFDSGVFLRRKGICSNAGLIVINGANSGNVIQVAEGTTTSVEIERALPFDQPLTVTLTAGGSASASTDLVGFASSVTIPAGEASAKFDISILGDCEEEGLEDFYIIYTDSSLTCAGNIHTDTLRLDMIDMTVPLPAIDVGPDQQKCVGDTILFDAPPITGFTYSWSPNIGPGGIVVLPGNDSIPSNFEYWGKITRLSDGCSSADTGVVIASPPAVAAILTPDIVCDEGAFTLSSISSGYIESHHWTMTSTGGSSWTSTHTDTIVVVAPDVWEAQLVVGNIGCGFDTAISSILVHPELTYDPSGLPDSLCVGEVIQWDIQPSDPGLTYQWNFGPRIIATLTPFFAYQDSGTYQIEVVGGHTGCKDTLVHTVRVSVCGVNSIGQPTLDLKVAPNPASNWIQLDQLPTEGAEITLSDMSGRTILQESSSYPSHRLNLSGLPEAVYLLKVRADSGVWNGRIVLRK